MIREFRGDYFFLSNFYPCKIRSRKYKDLVFDSAEAAFQSAKAISPTIAFQFAGLDARDTKTLGRSIILCSEWEDIKLDVMAAVVEAKFADNPVLTKLLLDTGHHQLVEGNTWGDKFWGVHYPSGISDQAKGEGQNWLGKILMEERETLRANLE